MTISSLKLTQVSACEEEQDVRGQQDRLLQCSVSLVFAVVSARWEVESGLGHSDVVACVHV